MVRVIYDISWEYIYFVIFIGMLMYEFAIILLEPCVLRSVLKFKDNVIDIFPLYFWIFELFSPIICIVFFLLNEILNLAKIFAKERAHE